MDHFLSKAASNMDILQSRASTSHRTAHKKSGQEYKSALGQKDNILEDKSRIKAQDLDDLRLAECVFRDLFMDGVSKKKKGVLVFKH